MVTKGRSVPSARAGATRGLVNATRPQEAIEPNLQAVQILREVAQASPGDHNPGLARSLRQLATAYRDAGYTSHAAACYHEAIAIHRDLAATRPGRRTWMALAESLAGLVTLQLTVQHPVDSLPLVLTRNRDAVASYLQELKALRGAEPHKVSVA